MAEPTQYGFDLNEVATALIKQQGIHEGLWSVGFEIVMGRVTLGQPPVRLDPALSCKFLRCNCFDTKREAPKPGRPLMLRLLIRYRFPSAVADRETSTLTP